MHQRLPQKARPNECTCAVCDAAKMFEALQTACGAHATAHCVANLTLEEAGVKKTAAIKAARCTWW